MSRPDLSAMHRSELEATIVSQTKIIERFRNMLGSIVMDIEDEGDRAYFGSTNDADELRDIERDMLESLNTLECPWMQGRDLYAELRELRSASDEARRALEPFGSAETLEQLHEDDEEWAKFRFLVKDYRRAGKALDRIDASLGDPT